MVQAARSEAAQILAAAQKRAKELTATARQESQIEAQTILATATAAAEKDKQQRLTAATAEIEKQIFLDDATRQQAVAAVVCCVCS
jgi:vacuolar-type H+-ATPase subunit H